MFTNGVTILEGASFERGCPVGTPAASGDDDDLRTAAAEVFTRWSKAISRAARREGRSPRSADDLGTVLVSLYEGALLVARTEKSTRPMRSAAAAAGRLVAG